MTIHSTRIRTRAAAAVFAASALVLASCADDGEDANGADTTTAEDTATTEEQADDQADAALVGAGCDQYAEMHPEGPGSVEAMADQTLSEALAENQELATLNQALTGELNPEVDLTAQLDEGEYTVFAPVNDAFDAVEPETLTALQEDADLLNQVLTYHLVEGLAGPDDVEGSHTTLAGPDIEVTGEGDEIQVGGANLICGGIETQNATLYLIDAVLMPTDEQAEGEAGAEGEDGAPAEGEVDPEAEPGLEPGTEPEQ